MDEQKTLFEPRELARLISFRSHLLNELRGVVRPIRGNCEVSPAGVGSKQLGEARKRKRAEKIRKKQQRKILKSKR
jgi:hypothetical protein